jgi:autotransporter adhesin
VALGDHSTASGDNSVAVGRNALASSLNTLALGANAAATAPNSIAIGAGSVANEPNTVSIGTAGPGGQRRMTNVAPGHEQFDAINAGQFKAGIAATAALPTIITPSEAGRTTVSANASYFLGEVGYGLGVAHRLEIAPSAVLDASVSEGSSKEWVARAGFAFEF